MNDIRDYLKHGLLIADGAMGTYFSEQINSVDTMSEKYNIIDEKIIKDIHEQYINAGARLIRTNTFAANTQALEINEEELIITIRKAYQIAKSAVGDREIYIAANIGPIPHNEGFDVYAQYKLIVDIFIEEGADVFLFETFSSAEDLKQITEYIKKIKPHAFIICEFILDSSGVTRMGISAETIIDEIRGIKSIDCPGFNCGTGPTHIKKIVKRLNITGFEYFSVMPNAGYPEVVNNRTVFPRNPDYFANALSDLLSLGVRIVGGCCGTTPPHIQALNKVFSIPIDRIVREYKKQKHLHKRTQKENTFLSKIDRGEFVKLVEIDPPISVDMENEIKKASALKGHVDLITVADSPLARSRVDSITAAGIIKQKTGINTMPHLCCRDRNIIGLRSAIMGAGVLGIDNILAVTGDPIPSADRMGTKSVFNMNSVGLMDLINGMNKEFDSFKIGYGGAFSINAINKKAQFNKLQKKVIAGAKFFLTQPVLDDTAIEFIKYAHTELDAAIIGGIYPMVSKRNALFLHNEVPGMTIPQEYIDRFDFDMSREEAESTGIEIAVEIAERLYGHVDGFYFMTPFNRTEMIVKIIERLKI